MRKPYFLIAFLIGTGLTACRQGGSDSPEGSNRGTTTHYEPDWASLENYSCPDWFRDAKFGIYTHWGPYSVPSWENEWYPRLMYSRDDEPRGRAFYLHHKENWGDVSVFGYKDFIPLFTADKFDADEWAELFSRAGARFAGPVAEHHDGFAMWNSRLTEWDAMDMGPERDVLGELAKALRSRDIRLVTSFHHAFHWRYYEPSYSIPDSDTKDPQYTGVDKIYPPLHSPGDKESEEFLEDWYERVKEVVDAYRPDYLWFDFGWGQPGFIPYQKKLLAYYYNQAQDWGKEVVVTYKGNDLPRGVAVLDLERGQLDTLSNREWITDTSLDRKSWCYISDPDYKSVNSLVDNLVDIVSKNGNLLLNVAPRPDGTIPDEQKERLLGIGSWLDMNGEAIYGTRPWIIYGEGPTKMATGNMTESRNKGRDYTSTDIRFTTRENFLYVLFLDWPDDGGVLIRSLKQGTRISEGGIDAISLLGSEEELTWTRTVEGLRIGLPEEKPCDYAFCLRIELRGDWIRPSANE